MSRAEVSVAVFGWFVLTMWSTAGTSLADEAGTPNKRQPNIVFILADDLGWSDTSLYGTSDFYRTPNVQRLARRGMTFDRAYAASPLCSPTRASILTGLSPARHGITSPNCHTPTVRLQSVVKQNAAAHQFSIQPDPVTRLDPNHITIAETLRTAGYATGHFGKWHLGAEPYSPLQHGFDIDVPHWHGPGPAGSYVAPWKFPDFDHDPDVPDQHIEDRMAQEAVQFMRQHRDQPFFLNYWMFSVHAPFDAKAALIEKYAKTVDPTDQQRCPTYAAMIESMDDAIGTLLDELDRLQVAENTIIVFASDNGGNMYNLVDGQRPTSNRPLRGGKATVYEGGIRTPAIVVWPGHVESGTTSGAMIQSVDYFPTLLDMLGMAPASDQLFDGISFVPALTGGAIDRDGIFTYFPHNPPVPDWLPPSICVHQDDWKLIRIFHGGDDTGHRYKLFNLRDDIGEQHDLSAMMPERVQQMDALIERHLRETGAVVPQANPSFDPKKYDIASEGAPAAKFLPGGASTKRRKSAKPVAGWQPAGTCELSIGDGKLLVHSTGGDPYFSYRLQPPIDETAFVLQMEITSNAGGSGQVFWQTEGGGPFTAKRSEVYSPTHDGDRHFYVIKFRTQGPLSAIRVDPATAVGDIQVHAVRLVTQDGRLVHQWAF